MTELTFHGIRMHLLPSRTAYLPDEGLLLVADLHLGKDATFRARGIPVPSGPSAETLERLEQAIRLTRCRSVALLGDLFHGRESNEHAERLGLEQLIGRHPALEVHLILGNHDRWVQAEHLPGTVHRRFEIGGVSLVHDPADACGPSIAGHLHPGFRLSGRARSGYTLPCFWVHEQCLVMPAFGEFTGFRSVPAVAGDRVFVVTGSNVCEVPC